MGSKGSRGFCTLQVRPKTTATLRPRLGKREVRQRDRLPADDFIVKIADDISLIKEIMRVDLNERDRPRMLKQAGSLEVGPRSNNPRANLCQLNR